MLSGKVELGQGLRDALTLICSAELALDPSRIRVLCGDTDQTPDDGVTAGSNSMEHTGAAVRAAAAPPAASCCGARRRGCRFGSKN